MRFRKSHVDREQPERLPVRYDRFVLQTALALAGATVIGWGVWYVVTTDNPLGLSSLSSDKPADEVVARPWPKTAEAKTLQEAYEGIEFALAQAFNNLQADPGRVKEKQPWTPLSEYTWAPAQRVVRVSSDYSLSQCNHEIYRCVRSAGAEVIAATENTRTRELHIQIAYSGKVMHDLTVIRVPDLAKKRGRMVIVLEDLGAAPPDVARRFIAISRPLTFGIVPWKGRSDEMVRAVLEKKHDVVAQIPMEPYEYPRVSPGRRAIFVSQTEQQNRQIARDALAAVPQARGAMSYLGNRILGDARTLPPVLDEIKSQNRFFLDPLASRGSIGYALASKSGLITVAAWGEIDAVDNQERIATMLDLASYEALERGGIIVTGHARPNTLTVLQSRLERLELRGITVVPVDSLLHTSN